MVEVRHQLAQEPHHLLAVAGISRIHEQIIAPAAQYGCVAAAWRLYEYQLRALRQLLAGDARHEAFPAALSKHPRKSADAVKCSMRRQSALVQHLHRQIGIDHQRLPRLLPQTHAVRQL